MVALRVLAGLFRAIRRQICNTDLSGCNIRPVGKNTAFKFRLFSATLNRESSFFRTTRGGLNSEVSCFCQSGRIRIRRGLNSEGSTLCQSGRFKCCQSGRVIFCQSGGVPSRKGSVFTIRKDPFLPFRKNPTFVNLEGPIIRSGPFLSIGRGPRKIYNF